MLVKYQISSSSTGTAAGQSSILPVRKGKIKGIVFRGYIANGAVGSSSFSLELGYNQSTQVFAEAQNPSRQVAVAAMTTAVQGINVWGTYNSGFIPSNWDIEVGDQLCINMIQAGAVPTTARHMVDIYVDEN